MLNSHCISSTNNPFDLLKLWLDEEKENGAPNPQQAILSTVGLDKNPHSRLVAIREITNSGFYFFTQRGTRKVLEMVNNSNVALTFWFELKQRQTIVEGVVHALTDKENESYWRSYPRDAQLRFKAYAPTSSQPILSNELLEKKRLELEKQYENQEIPLDEYYCGFFIEAKRFIFYAYQPPAFSDVVEYSFTKEGDWHTQLLSP